MGDWLSGRAPRSHRGGHWFHPSIAHPIDLRRCTGTAARASHVPHPGFRWPAETLSFSFTIGRPHPRPGAPAVTDPRWQGAALPAHVKELPDRSPGGGGKPPRGSGKPCAVGRGWLSASKVIASLAVYAWRNPHASSPPRRIHP